MPANDPNASPDGDLASGHGYSAYGLHIRSEITLPELPLAAGTAPDVRVRRREVPPRPADADRWMNFEFAPDLHHMSWNGVGRFLIRGADSIDVDPAPTSADPLLALPLLGPVMAMLLHLRGRLVLHASTVEVHGRGAVFLGDKGAGKSTTAAALVGAGHGLVTDDVTAIDLEAQGGPLIQPGFPQLKLHAGAHAAAAPASERMPEPMAEFPKQLHRVGRAFRGAAVRPGRIYVLERSAQPGAEVLAPAAALPVLMRFSYVTRSYARAGTRPDLAAHLRQCAALAAAVPVVRLSAPEGLDRLGELVSLLETDMRAAGDAPAIL